MSDKTPAGAARIEKTKRVAYTITADDTSAGSVALDVVWDSPFTDLNYTSDQNVEVLAPTDPMNIYVNGFVKAVDKITVSVGLLANVTGAQIIVHARAVRD